MIIAIDGHAGAGKSTIAKSIAKKLGYLYLDTGAMYRALTYKVLEDNIDITDIEGITEAARSINIDLVNNPDGSLQVLLNKADVSQKIREPRITKFVSDIAKIKDVRLVMLDLQRRLGQKGNCILDVRDIGTVVFPNAQKKFYIDADFKERVGRRFKELKTMGQEITKDSVDKDLSNRDRIDSTREFAPLKRADDAIYVDTTNMSIEQVIDTILKHILT